MIGALEKYQGTQAAGPGQHRGEWAAAHARATQTYALGLVDQLDDTDAALAALAATLAADTRPIDTAAAQLESQRSAIAANGFSDADLKALRAIGLTDAQLDELRTTLGTTSFALTEAELSGDIAALRGEIASTQVAFNDLAGAMAPIIATLATAGTDDHPTLSAGGPYSGIVGTAVAFNGNATSTYAITSYDWDLDADGDFDDASGATPSRTYTQPFKGLIGLRATNSVGRVSIAYAPLSVTGGNGRPQLTASSPTNGPTIILNSSQAFSVTASDPDSDPVTVTWTLDESPVGTGANHTLTATPYNLGSHTLVATASDGKPFGTTQRVWSVSILAPDADSDGWRANVDCDDNDPQAGYCPAQPVPPDPANALVVTSTGDTATCPNGPGGEGYTLRCALTAANAAGNGKTITFAIPAGDPGCVGTPAVCTIRPPTTLPILTANNTAIDGFTQPGAHPNTNAQPLGNNAVFTIHLSGTPYEATPQSTGRNEGLIIAGSGNLIRGLAITNYGFNADFGTLGPGSGIFVSGSNTTIVGNSLGLTPPRFEASLELSTDQRH